MARAAGKKQPKRGERRADARGQRVTRAGAKRAHGTTARPRAAAKQRGVTKPPARKTVAKRRPAAKAAVAKRALKRTVTAVRTRVKSARKRVTRAGAAATRRLAGTVGSARAALRRRAAARAAAPAPARRRTARRPLLAPVPPAFAVQRAGASAREVLLFELARARASVKAAVQGLASGTAERPVAPGKWSIKEIVLHLSERDRVRLEEFARTLGGTRHSWAGMHDPEMRPVNEAHLAPLRAHSWDDALRRLDTMREQLLFRLAQVPAEPDDVWRRGHAFGDMLWGLPDHDRHHAAQIKLARIGAAGPVEA